MTYRIRLARRVHGQTTAATCLERLVTRPRRSPNGMLGPFRGAVWLCSRLFGG